MGRQFLGRAVFAPGRLYAGLHHRTGPDGQAEAGVRQAQRQGHRAVGRSGRIAQGWIKDIEETQQTVVGFPIIADADRKVAELYDMIHPNASATATVRTLFVIDPNKKVRLRSPIR
jgi:hypothetical protein